MFTRKELFITYIESFNKFVTVSSYNRVSIAGQGSVLFSAKLSSGQLNTTLCDVHYISYLGTNLVSLGALYHQGVFVQSFDKGLVLFKDGEELFRALLTGLTRTLYHIQCFSSVSDTACLAGGLLSICLWY